MVRSSIQVVHFSNSCLKHKEQVKPQLNNNQKKWAATVKLAKFKEWARRNIDPDSPLFQIIQKEKDELPLEEAVVKTEMICALIDSIDLSSLKNKSRTLEVS
jgi:hypothetical protein